MSPAEQPAASRHVIKNMNTRMANTPDRCGVELLVELEALVVHTAIKMDGQLGYPHDRLGTHQLGAPVGQHQRDPPARARGPARS